MRKTIGSRSFSFLLVAILAAAGLAAARFRPISDVHGLHHRLAGHPKNRFPLTIYTVPAGSPELQGALREAVADWNVVFQQALGMPAFAWTGDHKQADIIVTFTDSIGAMGETELDTDQCGIIELPVRIILARPRARGASSARQVLFDVAAHELGHALGLPHINRPRSIMCCDRDGINFSDPGVREAYIAARRKPDLSLVIPELKAHYDKFWRQSRG